MKIEANDVLCGKTVLSVLRGELNLSSKTITVLKKRDDGILAGGVRVTVRHVMQPGESLEINCDDLEPNENLVPTEMPLDILYEDDDIIAVNKPPMLPTHPSHGHFDDTLANGICFHVLSSQSTPFVFRAANRLDRNTSGIVLVAKNRISSSKLYFSMKNGKFKKKYVALLRGVPEKPEGTIETYIRRQKESIILREVCGNLPDASFACTEYRLISTDGKVSLVEAVPRTGRTHQLRLHFAHIGCPILGDDLYGEASEEISRQALHASFLSFPHPSSGKTIALSAPIPKDMSLAAKLHNLYYNPEERL